MSDSNRANGDRTIEHPFHPQRGGAYLEEQGGPGAPTLHMAADVAALIGRTPEEVVADSTLWITAIHPEDRPDAVAAGLRAEQTGRYDHEYRLLTPSGDVVWVHERADLLDGVGGGRKMWAGFILDVTPLHDLQSAEARYQALIEQLPSSVYLATNEVDFRILYNSPSVGEITGFSAEEWESDPGLWERQIHPGDAAAATEAWRHSVETGTDYEATYRITRTDGSERWIRDRAVPVRDADGTIACWEGLSEDVTEQREAERRLRESELRTRSLIETMPAAVFLLTPEVPAVTTFVSPQIEEIAGYPEQTWKDDPNLFTRSLHPEEADDVLARWRRIVATGEELEQEIRFRHHDGRWIWIREWLTPVRDSSGTIVAFQGFVQDVTRRHDAEDELQRALARYRSLVEHLQATVYVADGTDGALLYVSPHVQAMFGVTVAEALADPDMWRRMLHPDDRDRVVEAWNDAFSTGATFDAKYRSIGAEGRTVWVHDTSHPVTDPEGRVLFWQGMQFDETEAKATEALALESEARYRGLVEQLPVIVYADAHREHETEARYVSPNVKDVLGYPAERFLTDPVFWMDICHPDDLDATYEGWKRAWRERDGYTMQYRLRRADGSWAWMRDTSRIVFDPDDGEPVWQGVMVDISATKHAEAQLQASEARFRALVEQVPAIVYEMGLDDERRAIYVSPKVEEMLGYTRAEWLEQPDIWTELLHPDDREIELAAHDLHNETGESWRREYRLIAQDGRVVWVSDQAELIRDAAGAPLTWHGVMLDVTARKELEDELRRANDELEFRVLARTTELADANEMMALEIGERRRAESDLRRLEERYRRLVERLPAVTYIWDVDFVGSEGRGDAFISPQLEGLLGYTPAEWLRDKELWPSRIHPHDRERVLAAAARSEHHGDPFDLEYRMLTKDGRVVWVLDQATLLERDDSGRPLLFQGVLLDITARKEAEAKALRAEQRYRMIAEEGPVVAFLYELQRRPTLRTRTLYVSPQLSALLGQGASFDADDPMSAWAEHIHPDDRDFVIGEIAKTWETGVAWNYDCRTIGAGGRVIWFHTEGRTVATDDDGRPRVFHGVLIDVTEDREARAALEGQLQLYRGLVDGLPAIAYTELVDPETRRSRYAYISPQVEEILGYRPQDLIREPDHFLRMVHPADRERVAASSAAADRTGVWEDEYRVLGRNGIVRTFHSIARRRPSGPGELEVWHGLAFAVDDRRVPDDVGRGDRVERSQREEIVLPRPRVDVPPPPVEVTPEA